jgi:DNA-binding MarR family transcriptional regulator
VSSVAKSHRAHALRLLAQLEAHESITQRALARNLGIALGLTNLLLRQLVRVGWIEVKHGKPNSARYTLTAAGAAARARQRRHRRELAVRRYAQIRQIIRRRLEAVSPKRIVFFGVGEVAEIGFASLQGANVELVGIVGDDAKREFFGMAVQSPSCLTADALNGQPFDYVAIMSFRGAEKTLVRLEEQGIRRDRIICL